MIITTDILVQLCAKLAALSPNQANLQTSDFLNYANLSMFTLTQELCAASEEYLVYPDSLPVTIGQASYRIPYRALNGRVRHLWFEDGTSQRYRLYPRSAEQIENYNTNTVGKPDAFYVEGNYIVLLPTPNIAGTLQVMYPFRPCQLVDSSTVQNITAINTATNTITVNNIPTNFTSGITYDFIDALSGNGIKAYDQMGNISGDNIVFSSLPSTLQIGDWVAQSNQSPVPMIPEEGHPLLLYLTVMGVEMLRGNDARVKSIQAQIMDCRKAWDLLLSNRITSKAHPAGGGNPFMPPNIRY